MKPPLPESDPHWDALLDRELKRLPNRRAPETLIPRVIKVIETRARQPWYRQTWWHWPKLVQVMSLLGVSTLLGAIVWVCLGTDAAAMRPLAGGGAFDSVLAPLAALWSLVGALAGALGLVAKQAGGWALFGGMAVMGAAYLSCVGLGTVFYRVALRR